MFSYLSVLTAGYKSKPRRVVWVHLTLSRVALQVDSAAVVHCTLHGTLSHVWKAAAADTREIHDVARYVHGTHPVSVRNRQHRHEWLRCAYSLFICCIYKKRKNICYISIYITTNFDRPYSHLSAPVQSYSSFSKRGKEPALVNMGEKKNRFVYCYCSLVIMVRFCSCSEYFEIFSYSVRVL